MMSKSRHLKESRDTSKFSLQRDNHMVFTTIMLNLLLIDLQNSLSYNNRLFKVILLLHLALTAKTLASLHQGVAQERDMVPGQVFHICSSNGQIYQSWQGLNDQDILLLLDLPALCRK